MSIALHVLKHVWGKREGYVFIPRRRVEQGAQKWDEGKAFKYPEDMSAIKARVEQSVADGYDVYWCPLVFSSPRRHKDHAMPTYDILWADLDNVDPTKLGALRPSIAWASSDDRYQALWLLDGEYDVDSVESVNRDLTYTIGADKGGWDVTQVLRVPGSDNHKYDPPQQGRLLWAEKRLYSLDTVKSEVETQEPAEGTSSAEDIDQLLDGYDVPQRARMLLSMDEGEVEVGERSDRLWEIEAMLVEAGVPVLTIVKVIKQSVWNKYKGRRDEDKRIFNEVMKVEEQVKSRVHKASAVEEVDPEAKQLKEQTWAIPFGRFMTTKLPPPEWLVEGIWQAGTYGMIAGEPKTYKSVLSTDLALSVASGKPFLGKHGVHKQGAVLLVQEENNPQTMQDRVFKVAAQKKLLVPTSHGWELPDDLPIFFSNNYGIDLTNKDSRVLLEQTIQQIKPVLLILDPFYMMLGSANENDATEMRNTLHWLSMLRNKYGVAIIVLHHYNKGNDSKTRGGQKIRGTSEFHAWVESALYIKHTATPNNIKIAREFRSFPMMGELNLTVEMGEPGEPYYNVILNDEDNRSEDLQKEEILTVLSAMPRTFEEVKALCKLTRTEARNYLKDLVTEGYVEYDKGGGRGKQGKYYLTTGGASVVSGESEEDVPV